MEKIYGKIDNMAPGGTTYCPGCGHGIVVKLISEVLHENNWEDLAVQVNGVGCYLNANGYITNWDMIQTPHGRAASVATGAKHAAKDALVFSYQGDGDSSCIGMGETFHAASRRYPITHIMINNQIYGMTGGQTSPTTLIGQVTTTTDKNGRDPEKTGWPTRMAEQIALTEGPAFVGRFAVNNPKNIIATKKAIEKAFRTQLEDKRYSFLEILTMCPTNWHVNPWDTPKYVDEKVLPTFPLGVFKDEEKK